MWRPPSRTRCPMLLPTRPGRCAQIRLKWPWNNARHKSQWARPWARSDSITIQWWLVLHSPSCRSGQWRRTILRCWHHWFLWALRGLSNSTWPMAIWWYGLVKRRRGWSRRSRSDFTCRRARVLSSRKSTIDSLASQKTTSRRSGEMWSDLELNDWLKMYYLLTYLKDLKDS